jgi:hypothetical protein
MTVHFPPVFFCLICGNCTCILFPSHPSFVFFAMLSFIYLVPLSNSLFRLLAVCNIAELVVCWCNLTICISGFFLLSVLYEVCLKSSVNGPISQWQHGPGGPACTWVSRDTSRSAT